MVALKVVPTTSTFAPEMGRPVVELFTVPLTEPVVLKRIMASSSSWETVGEGTFPGSQPEKRTKSISIRQRYPKTLGVLMDLSPFWVIWKEKKGLKSKKGFGSPATVVLLTP